MARKLRVHGLRLRGAGVHSPIGSAPPGQPGIPAPNPFSPLTQPFAPAVSAALQLMPSAPISEYTAETLP